MNIGLEDDEQKLLADENGEFFERGILDTKRRRSQRLWVGGNVCFFVLSIGLFVASRHPRHLSDNECGIQLSGWSPSYQKMTPYYSFTTKHDHSTCPSGHRV